MERVEQITQLRRQVARYRAAGERVAFVPTMGNLHAGHLELVRQARQRAQRVVVSIYVNPLQFGAGEDLEQYPRTLQQDIEQLQEASCDLLFTPNDAIMYGAGERSRQLRIEVPGIAEQLCGASRPGHFSGVATVVAKLFNMVQPEIALFGEKDYQQLLVIRQLVEQLNFPVEVVGVPTVREADGLAMSSRNGYLTQVERGVAPELNRVLRSMGQQLQEGTGHFVELETSGRERLELAGFEVDYLSIRQHDLEMPSAASKQLVILVAARLGSTRLIDNYPLTLR